MVGCDGGRWEKYVNGAGDVKRTDFVNVLFGLDNSAKRWESLLAEITHVELLAAKSRSLVEKLFDSNEEVMCEQVGTQTIFKKKHTIYSNILIILNYYVGLITSFE